MTEELIERKWIVQTNLQYLKVKLLEFEITYYEAMSHRSGAGRKYRLEDRYLDKEAKHLIEIVADTLRITNKELFNFIKNYNSELSQEDSDYAYMIYEIINELHVKTEEHLVDDEKIRTDYLLLLTKYIKKQSFYPELKKLEGRL